MKRPKMDTPTAIGLLTPARHTREHVEHFLPVVLYVPRRGPGYTAILDGEGTLDQMLAHALEQMRARLGPAEWIAVTTDAFSMSIEDPGALPEGTLAEAFANGDPHVVEQMVVVLNHRRTGVEVATQTYRYTPADGWEWAEPVECDDYSSMVLAVLNYYM